VRQRNRYNTYRCCRDEGPADKFCSNQPPATVMADRLVVGAGPFMRADPGHCQPQASPCGARPSAALEESTFAIGELAAEFRITQRTLRFYEARGLLSPQRNGAERRYNEDDRGRIALILRAKRLGFTLREIAALMAAQDCNSGALLLSRRACTEQINLLERQKREIEAALTELRQVYSNHYVRALKHGECRD
jgi:DNA-binding transcriptional MerR regulator